MTRYPVYVRGIATEPKVALTFDDGPNPPRTEQLLEILAKTGSRATFFTMGKWAERFPRTVDRVLAGGHLVGNHGYEGQGWIGDYDQAEAVIGHLTGAPSRYLRPHTFNYASYFQSRIAQLPESHTIGRDIDSDDWQTTDPDTIVRAVLDHPKLGSGSIIVFHDGAENEEAAIRLRRPLPMLEAMPRIIAGLKERGLRCVRVDEMALAEPLYWESGSSTPELESHDHLAARANALARSPD
ncbi:MAG TPA: polysaccharide deacetylase family protein [Chloroflexota bacterium]|nr:polysaccharide deacetylase family protein [Chloroflexota bacterium]